jgi:hypothetical protein
MTPLVMTLTITVFCEEYRLYNILNYAVPPGLTLLSPSLVGLFTEPVKAKQSRYRPGVAQRVPGS